MVENYNKRFSFKNRNHDEQVSWTSELGFKKSNIVVIIFNWEYKDNFGHLFINKNCSCIVIERSTKAYIGYYLSDQFCQALRDRLQVSNHIFQEVNYRNDGEILVSIKRLNWIMKN
jgi:hypothetical protein